jgi:excisionase family DNA binding protein
MSTSSDAWSAADRLWDVDQVAEYIGFSRSWVKEKAANGTLPALRIGKKYRFVPAAVMRWAAQQQVKAPVVGG